MLDFRSPHLLPLDLGDLLQQLHLDLANQRFVHVDPEFPKGSDDLLRVEVYAPKQ